MAKRGLPEGVYLLSDPDTLSEERVRKGEWLGIYQDGKLVCASRSPLALSRRVRRLRLMFLPVMLRRAPSRRGLPQKLVSDPPDPFRYLKQVAFEAIAEARKRLNPDWPLHPQEPEVKEAEMQEAKQFLRDLANMARAQGKSRGDRATEAENRKILSVLSRLAAGESLKEIAIEQAGVEGFEARQRSLSVSIKRFSEKICRPVRNLYGHVPAGLSDARLKYFVRKWPGVSFPKHLPALREALKRGSSTRPS